MEERVGAITEFEFKPGLVVVRRTSAYTRGKILALVLIPVSLVWFAPWRSPWPTGAAITVVALVGIAWMCLKTLGQKGAGVMLAVTLGEATPEGLKAERTIRAADVLAVTVRENVGRLSDDFPYLQMRLRLRPEAGGGEVLVHQKFVGQEDAITRIGIRLAGTLGVRFISEATQ
jgi:hypothetical protein